MLYDIFVFSLAIVGIAGVLVCSYRMAHSRVYPIGIVRKTPETQKPVDDATAKEIRRLAEEIRMAVEEPTFFPAFEEVAANPPPFGRAAAARAEDEREEKLGTWWTSPKQMTAPKAIWEEVAANPRPFGRGEKLGIWWTSPKQMTGEDASRFAAPKAIWIGIVVDRFGKTEDYFLRLDAELAKERAERSAVEETVGEHAKREFEKRIRELEVESFRKLENAGEEKPQPRRTGLLH